MRKLPYQSSLQLIQRPQLLWNDIGACVGQLFPPDWAEMPIKVTYQNPGLEYDENMVCEDFLNMGMLPLESYVYTHITPSARWHGLFVGVQDQAGFPEVLSGGDGKDQTTHRWVHDILRQDLHGELVKGTRLKER